jgi:hypothetical protein
MIREGDGNDGDCALQHVAVNAASSPHALSFAAICEVKATAEEEGAGGGGPRRRGAPGGAVNDHDVAGCVVTVAFDSQQICQAQ